MCEGVRICVFLGARVYSQMWSAPLREPTVDETQTNMHRSDTRQVASAAWWRDGRARPLVAAGLLLATLALVEAADADRDGRTGAARSFALAAGIALLFGVLSKEVVLAALPPVALWLWRGRGVGPPPFSIIFREYQGVIFRVVFSRNSSARVRFEFGSSHKPL